MGIVTCYKIYKPGLHGGRWSTICQFKGGAHYFPLFFHYFPHFLYPGEKRGCFTFIVLGEAVFSLGCWGPPVHWDKLLGLSNVPFNVHFPLMFQCLSFNLEYTFFGTKVKCQILGANQLTQSRLIGNWMSLNYCLYYSQMLLQLCSL